MYKPSGFIPADLKINAYKDIQPYYEKLVAFEIKSAEDLEKLILSYSEVSSVFYEQNARAYIEMTCHTDNADFVKRHEMFSSVIGPEIEKISHDIQKKISENSHFKNLPNEKYGQLKKSFLRDIEMFRLENIRIEAEVSMLSSKYGQLAGSLLAKLDGKEVPIPQASVHLQSNDREVRKTAWFAIHDTYQQAKNAHNDIFDAMLKLRHQIATNTGYKNYRDYQHDHLQRFDYTVTDVLQFHEAIKIRVKPLQKRIAQKQCEKLGLENDFRPWDQAGKPKGENPLKPFEKADELLAKTIQIFDEIRPDFGNNLRAMQKNNLFDLDSRKAKAPGGYNYGLEITGMPFIFMNAAGTHRDVVTLMHEGGHAMHTFLTNNQPLIQNRHTPSEMAETASMSMELMSSRHWDKFYNKTDLVRARREHIEGIVDVLPWIAIVDKFQHWIYTNPEHSREERDNYFDSVLAEYATGLINWDGLERYRKNIWHKQLHIFEVPFYYIEYGIAQLGALQIYKNFCENPKKALDDYARGLAMGGTRGIPEIWQAMNIRFDFSEDNLASLMDFVEKEWESLA